MRKLTLDPDKLVVDSFSVAPEAPTRGRGTVRAHATMDYPCVEYMTYEYVSCDLSACGCTAQGCYTQGCPTAATCAPRVTCNLACPEETGDCTVDIKVC